MDLKRQSIEDAIKILKPQKRENSRNKVILAVLS